MSQLTAISSDPDPAPTDAPSARIRQSQGRFNAYTELTKARLSLLVVWTTAIGYVVALESGESFGFAVFLATVLGTALCAGSASALNQIVERSRDEVMHRTRHRPLPSGALSLREAVIAGVLSGVVGLAALLAIAGPLPAALAALTIALYVGVYTPLKTRTTLNTLVGAVVGAIPPMIGWAAVRGDLGTGAWVLAALLFIWQLPHFLSLAWIYREDYHRGGFIMLPALDPTGRMTCRVVLLTSLMLLPVACTAAITGVAGWFALVGALLLGGWMSLRAAAFCRAPGDLHAAQRVFRGSLVYLPLVLVLLAVDRGSVLPGRPVTPLMTADSAMMPVALKHPVFRD